MAEHANATILRRAYKAFGSGDFDALNEFIPKDTVWHVTGNSSLSGDYKGRDAVYGYFGKLMELTGGTFKATALQVLGDDDMAVAIQQTNGTVNGKDVSSHDVLVDRMVDGQAVETWVYFENDQILDS